MPVDFSTALEVTGTSLEVTGTALEVTGKVLEVTGKVPEVTGKVPEVTGTLIGARRVCHFERSREVNKRHVLRLDY